MVRSKDVKEMRLEVTMTEEEDIEPTISDAADASVEHCIITFRKDPSRIRTAGRSVLHLRCTRSITRIGHEVT